MLRSPQGRPLHVLQGQHGTGDDEGRAGKHRPGHCNPFRGAGQLVCTSITGYNAATFDKSKARLEFLGVPPRSGVCHIGQAGTPAAPRTQPFLEKQHHPRQYFSAIESFSANAFVCTTTTVANNRTPYLSHKSQKGHNSKTHSTIGLHQGSNLTAEHCSLK